MAKEIILDDKVAKDLPEVKKVISKAAAGKNAEGAVTENLYQTVVALLSDATRNNQNQLNYLEAYEKAVSVFREASLNLRQSMDTQTLVERLGVLEEALREKTARPRAVEATRARFNLPNPANSAEEQKPQAAEDNDKTQRDALKEQITEAVSFSNRYALYFAGQVGLALLDGEKAKEVDNRFFFGTKYEAAEDRNGLASLLAVSTTDGLKKIVADKKTRNEEVNDDDLKHTLECVFTSWISQFKWNTFKDVAKKYSLEDLSLKFQGFTNMGNEFSRKYDIVIIDPKFMNIRKADLIGNEEYHQEVWSTGKKVLGWDEKTRRNPGKPPVAIITYGGPGGGKTFSAHAIIQELGELARKRKVPLWAFPLSIADIGSKYQNESCNKLDLIIEQVRVHPGPVIMYVPDTDAVIPSREGEATNEDIKLAGVFFSMLDGSRIPKGKFIFWGDMNYIDKLDEASKSRLLSAKFLELKRFVKPEEFALYTRNYLTKDGDTVGISDREWLEIGKYLISTELSNREVTNVLNNITGSFDVPEELVGKPVEEWDAARRAYTQNITMDRVIKDCDEYIEKRMRVERESYENRMQGTIKKFKTDITRDPKLRGQTETGTREA